MTSATHDGFGAPSTSNVNSIVTCAPPAMSSTSSSFGAEAQLRADRHGRREAHLVAAVVHAHRDAVTGMICGDERRAERQREVAVGDRAAEGPGLGPLDVDVDPLVVAGGVGELVDLLLGDLDLVAVAEVLADLGLQPVDAFDDRRHGRIIADRRGGGGYLNQMRS